MPRCPSCHSCWIQRFGQSSNQKQRFLCCTCHRTFIWKKSHVKRNKEKHWFRLWVTENYSIRHLASVSGYSSSKLKRIKSYWLEKSPPELQNLDRCKYMIMDGTYFHKDGCLLTLMNGPDQKILSDRYTSKESFLTVFPWLQGLKDRALEPHAFTTDGERSTLRAIRALWPDVITQRCLYHIQHEGCRWLRTYPKTTAGKTLRALLLTLTEIRSVKERDQFVSAYKAWLDQYQPFVLSLPMHIKANFDLRRTITLINNALPNMFHYLMNPLIHSTTNALEGWHSRIKRAYRQHAGLIQRHKIQFLKWFSFYENQQKINN